MKTLMRKRLLASALLLTAFAAPVASSAEKADPDAELLAVRKSAWVSWFGGDTATLGKLIPKDGLFISPDTKPWQTTAETLAGSKKFHDEGGKLLRLEFPRTEIKRYGDLAILFTTYEFEIETGGKKIVERGKAVEVFQRKGGKWTHPTWFLQKDEAP